MSVDRCVEAQELFKGSSPANFKHIQAFVFLCGSPHESAALKTDPATPLGSAGGAKATAKSPDLLSPVTGELNKQQLSSDDAADVTFIITLIRVLS